MNLYIFINIDHQSPPAPHHPGPKKGKVKIKKYMMVTLIISGGFLEEINCINGQTINLDN